MARVVIAAGDTTVELDDAAPVDELVDRALDALARARELAPPTIPPRIQSTGFVHVERE